MRSTAIASFALIILVALPLTAQDAERAAKTDALFADYAGKKRPGFAVGVVSNGELVHARGYGLANLEHDIPLTAGTMFRLASVSKQFTAACVARLALRGELSLDDDVRKHFPRIHRHEETIRVSHLLHHTSGLRDYIGLHRRVGESIEYEKPTRSLELIFAEKSLAFAPGEKYSYSNSNYLLLGDLVRRVSGKGLDDFAREELFRPLGMKASRYHDDHRKVVPGRADGHVKRRDGWRISNTTCDHVGDGGVFSSIEELALWERFWTDASRLEGGAELQEAMLTRGDLNDGKKTDYALGLVHGTWKGRKVVGHGGSWVGFRTHVLRVPEQKLAVICLANFARARPERQARRILEIWAK